MLTFVSVHRCFCPVAFAAFDECQSGYLSFSAVERYFTAFFTVVFDLSVSLQEHILQHTDCVELARATTKQLFHSAGRTAQISYAEFRRWYEAQDVSAQPTSVASPGGRIVQDSEEESNDSEEEYEDEEDEEAVSRATEAAEEARYLAAQLQQRQQQFKAWEAKQQQQQRQPQPRKGSQPTRTRSQL
jgi:hypothetical protein